MNISRHIQAIKIPFQIPVAPDKKLDRFVYVYLVKGLNKICLIDTGVAGSEKIIAKEFVKIDIDLADISQVILTHAHPDHIGAAKEIKKQCSCELAVHPSGKEWVEDVDKQFQKRPVPGFHSLVSGSVAVDKELKDNDIIDLGGVALQVIYTPGHSKCSISLFCLQDGVLFSGDAIPQGNDLPIYDDVAVAVASIRKLKNIEGIKTLLASWSDPQPRVDPYQLMDNGLAYFQRIHDVIRQLPGRDSFADPMDLCREMVTTLGLPEVAVNPLIAKSFASHLPFVNQEVL